MIPCSNLILLSEMKQVITQWPEGYFALPKPYDGCPPGAEEGFGEVYQDNEDYHNMNTNSQNNYLYLRQYTSPKIISLDFISLGFLVYIDAVCRL